jgi:hypothetical protein
MVPAILHPMGRPLLGDMDGRGLQDLFSRRLSSKHPSESAASADFQDKQEAQYFVEEEAAIVDERLKAPGLH